MKNEPYKAVAYFKDGTETVLKGSLDECSEWADMILREKKDELKEIRIKNMLFNKKKG